MILFVSLGLMNPSQAATRRRCGAARPGRCGARSVRSDLGPQARFGQVRLRSALTWWFGDRPVGVPTPRPRHGSAARVRVDRRGPRPRDRAVLTFLLSECEANWLPPMRIRQNHVIRPVPISVFCGHSTVKHTIHNIRSRQIDTQYTPMSHHSVTTKSRANIEMFDVWYYFSDSQSFRGCLQSW